MPSGAEDFGGIIPRTQASGVIDIQAFQACVFDIIL